MRTIYLLTSIRSIIFLTTAILGGLSFTACERKTTSVEMTLPSNPTLQPLEPIPSMPVVPETRTFETSSLGVAIDAFEKAPTEESQAAVKFELAKLDIKISELDDRVIKSSGADRADALTQVNHLQWVHDSEMNRFIKDQDGLTLDANPPAVIHSADQKTDDRDEGVGEKVEEGAKKVGRTVGKAIRKTGEAITDVSQ